MNPNRLLARPKPRFLLVSAFLVVIFIAVHPAVSISWGSVTPQVAQKSNMQSTVAAQSFQHIFVIQFENKAYEQVILNSYFVNLASRGLSLTNFYALRHPSQPNYLAQIAGDTFVTDDSSHDWRSRIWLI